MKTWEKITVGVALAAATGVLASVAYAAVNVPVSHPAPVNVVQVASVPTETPTPSPTPTVVPPTPEPAPVAAPADPPPADPPADPAPSGPDLCPDGTQANSSDGTNDTSCLPVVCFTIALPDPGHPECDYAYPPDYYR